MIKNSIILIAFPFDDLSASKVRPALCLTNEIGKYNHVIIAFISSRIPEDSIDSDIVLLKHSENFIITGLTVDSVIRLHKMMTIPKKLIKRRLGTIHSSLEVTIKEKINRLFN